ncbi:nucleotide-binding protein [Alkaliphilus transvaalensis]|uniref:nucleotide-binding protein n=1 Tax=Alkaliphilus transvaalensis TaxID=114628 RepID=UPI00047B3B41|nr:AAA family ATPase [Alkaliphilus transvaalensis]
MKTVGDDMRTLLIAGVKHEIVKNYLNKKVDVVNTKELSLNSAADFILETGIVFDNILVLKDAVPNQDYNMIDTFTELFTLLETKYNGLPTIVFLSNDPIQGKKINNISKRYSMFHLLIYDETRLPSIAYHKALEVINDRQKGSSQQKNLKKAPNNESIDKEKKSSFFDRFRKKAKDDTSVEARDSLSKEIEKISKGISRVVAITGHRGMGLTSTVVNVAYEANKRGLSTIIVDLDIDYRSTNMYFNGFYEFSQEDEDISASLIRTLAKPQDYQTTAYQVKDDLWLTSLSYQFDDKRLIQQLYSCNRLIGLISVLRQKFNLVIVDLPMDLLKEFQEALIHIDVFGLCVPNNLHGIFNTLKNIENVLDDQQITYLNAKTKVIVTKYNDRAKFQGEIFTAEKVCEVLTSDLSENFNIDTPLAGFVPYSPNFDEQIESDIPIVNSTGEYTSAYANILLRLMEGVK